LIGESILSTPKGQHTIPRLHLQHFAGAEGRVFTYDAIAGKVWAAVPEETAVETHFYSAELADGSIDTSIEAHLSRIETAAAPIYVGLLSGKIPGPTQERADFAHFLGLTYSRTVAMRRMAAEAYGKMLQAQMHFAGSHPKAFESVIQSREAELGRKMTPEEREAARRGMLDPSRFEFEVPKGVTFRALGLADELAPMFFHMNWYLIEAAEGYFISCDNPLVREVRRDTVHPIYGDGGFLNETAEVTFPLSPHKLLLMAWSNAPRRASVPLESVGRANQARAAQSDRFLYSHLKSAEIEQLAARFRDSRPSMTVEGAGPKKYGKVTVDSRLRQRPKNDATR
jgi:Protein of unknown function (DUF4238)